MSPESCLVRSHTIKVASSFAIGFAALLATSLSRAQGVDEFGVYGPTEDRTVSETPQEAAVELRFGPYRPKVDEEFDGAATPFEDVFGNDTRFQIGLEVDWQALRIPEVGSLGPGISIGYTRFSGRGFAEDGVTRSREESKLSIIPMHLSAVLRVDALARKTPLPLVPYGKLGLGAAAWWASSGDEASKVGNSEAKDWSYGYHFALGGMFLLDVLEPNAAIEMDSTLGINNSYVFVEWFWSSLDGFGSGDQMQVGTNTWVLGLAFEI